MPHIVVGTAGHIDHGKSTLVLALTGTDPDRLKEEKARGITIDLGFAHVDVGGTTFAFVDVPGHERFVKNMLAGATGIDLVALVVAADESVMPQTREHFDICRLLNVSTGLVVLTKADLVDADTLELVSLEVRELVAGSFLEGAPVVPVSARTGAGLDALRAKLLEVARHVSARDTSGPARLPIDRVFTVKGFGTVVTGTLGAGTLRPDDELEVLPSAGRVKVRGLQGHGRSLDAAAAGQRVAVNVAGPDLEALSRGDVLATPGTLAPTRRFDARLSVLPGIRGVAHGARVRIHVGTSEVLGRVAVSKVIAPEPDAEKAGSGIPPGADAYVRVRLERPVAVTRADRFIVRAYSPQITVAGGLLLDPHPPRGAIRTEAGRARFQVLDPTAHPDDEARAQALERVADENGVEGIPAAMVVSRLGLTPVVARAVIERLSASGRLVVIGDRLVSGPALAAAEERLLAAVREYHATNPMSDGVPREEARERVFARAPVPVFEHVLSALGARGELGGRDRLALASHRVALAPEDARAMEAVERAYRKAGLKPPDAGALAVELSLSSGAVDRAVQLLLRRRSLAKLDSLLFHQEALDALKHDVAGLKRAGATAKIDVATFKERFGLSRKFAIPLLEYLDRERVTRRVGEARVVI